MPPSSPSQSPEIMAGPDTELRELNRALQALAAAFPNIRPEVFREMLVTLSEESRAQVVTEHLLRDGAKWVKGRWRYPARETSSQILREVYELNLEGRMAFGKQDEARKSQEEVAGQELVPLEESFRSASYKNAVYNALRQEFKNLSRSTIRGVLAEQNHSYTLSRPILVGLAAKSWRLSLSSLFSRFTRVTSNMSSAEKEHYMLQWTSGPSSDRTLTNPYLRPSGDHELDRELQRDILNPLVQRIDARKNAISLELAILLNEQEAEQAGATYDCQVCFAEITFEQITACTSSQDMHLVCFRCIQRAMSEAIYGQSWDLTVDHNRGQMACIASAGETCDGCIPRDLAKRAIMAGRAGDKMWKQFEKRLSEEALQNSSNLVTCPFCPYSEIDALYLPSDPVWTLNTRQSLRTVFLLILGLDIVALVGIVLFVPVLITLLLGLSSVRIRLHKGLFGRMRHILNTSLSAHARQTFLPGRFVCKNPECGKPSCLSCRKVWRDIHKCHESAALSLRTSVEAARTAALKRTCPRCGVGFVKDSGCNKMVCVCGYVMCYICRQGLGEKKSGRLILGDVETPDQGYRHFCQHFRPLGGRCMECDRCDLYKSEDEDEIVRRAGERAEREWRERNDMVDNTQITVHGQNSGAAAISDRLKRVTIQSIVDWWISRVLVCRLETERQSSDEVTK